MTDYFDSYFFTSNISDYTCPGFGSIACPPPKACARDPNTGRRYCCDYQHPPYKGVCWALKQDCATDGSTLDCGTGDKTWCCINSLERCTERTGQINICWANAHDTLNNITNDALNQTYSSLSKAKPSATTWAFTPINVVAATNPAITQTQASSVEASSTATSSIASSTPTDNTGGSGSGSGLHGGAVAGVAVGVVGGVALVFLGLFMLWKRKQREQAYASVSPAAAPIFMADGKAPEGAEGAEGAYSDAYGHSPAPPTELDGQSSVAHELPGSYGGAAHSELSAASPVVASFGVGTASGSGSASGVSPYGTPHITGSEAHRQ